MGYSVSRLTLYAILSAIEDDMRDVIFSYLANEKITNDSLQPDIFQRAVERFKKDATPTDDDKKPSLSILLTYIDFGDAFQIINASRNTLPKQIAKYFEKTTSKLEQLVPIRNRVAHSRPLNFSDLSVTLDIANSLVASTSFSWNELKATLARLSTEPSFVLGLEIPSYYLRDSRIGCSHNLPIPDYDETGFLGREHQVKNLLRLCQGPYPVMTIIGDGGIGKTALALKVAYDILDLPNNPFDAVVFTTSKTRTVTAQEIRNIEGAIFDSLGMLQNIASNLAGEDTEDPIEEILSYLTEFKILLILDNLETVLDDRIRSFLEKLPNGSKVLITSRIGLGAFEYPVKLNPLDNLEAVHLLRELAIIRQVPRLIQIENRVLGKYCDKMQNNPGYIKWFVSAIQAGKRPEEVLDQPDIFLDFCMSNVYDYLSESSREVLNAMLCAPSQYSQAELAFLTEMEALQIQSALQELLKTNMVTMTSIPTGSSFTSEYTLADLPREYLSKHHHPNAEEQTIITKRRRQLVAAEEEAKALQKSKPYSPMTIDIRTSSDLVVAKYLRNALFFTNEKLFSEAEKEISNARGLAPAYFEVHRVDAWLKVAQRNMVAARNSYEAAIELEPKHAPLLVWYAEFLLKYLDDSEEALKWFKEAAKVDPLAFDVQWGIARTSLFLRRFDDARRALDKLFEMQEKLTSEKLRRMYDLYLQAYRREADFFLSTDNFEAALVALENLTVVYQNCPWNLIDNRIRDILHKACYEADRCAALIDNKDKKQRAIEISEWLYFEVDKTQSNLQDNQIGQSFTGVIARINSERPFGFLRTDSGAQLFFHRDEMYDPSQWQYLKVGTSVKLTVSSSQRGLRAIGVRIIED